MKLVFITLIFLLEEISSFPKNVPPHIKKGSAATPSVSFLEMEHERKDSKKHNRIMNEAEVIEDNKDEAEVELDDHCKPCNTVLTEILIEYEKSSGWLGHVDFAIKKVRD